MRTSLVLLFSVLFNLTYAQGPYTPAAGQAGSSAIEWNDSRIIAWGKAISLERGYRDISDQSSGKATHGEEEWALGEADLGAVSFGDGGSAIITFENPIINLDGPDFAIFENSFSDTFLELAFVEVSSDGSQYFRFPNHSLTQFTSQIDGFGSIDPTDIDGLAGKYRGNFGTPFDLDELKGTAGLDVNNISHVKIIDAVGSIDDDFATKDSQGNVINDPWPTDFESGGFDLDAVGVLSNQYTSIEERNTGDFSIFPNPAKDDITILHEGAEAVHVEIYTLTGVIVLNTSINSSTKSVSIESLDPGLYWVRLVDGNQHTAIKLCVQR